MKLERLDFKEFVPGKQVEHVVRGKPFIPSHKKAEPPPPPPSFTETQMLESEREGYKKGFLAGEKEGHKKAESEQAEVNVQLVAMLDTFVKSVAPMFEHYRQMTLQFQKDVPNIALAIARKVATNALDAHAEAVVLDIATRACETMNNEPELTIVTNEKMADTLERKFQEMAAKLPAATKIVVVRDPETPPADCRIEWRGGSLERVTAHLWEQVEKSIGNMQDIATREATEELETLQTQLTPEPPKEKE